MKYILTAFIFFILGMGFAAYVTDLEWLVRKNKFDSELINAYIQYEKGAEELLGILEEETGWPDRHDVKDYYEGLHRVDSLCATQL